MSKPGGSVRRKNKLIASAVAGAVVAMATGAVVQDRAEAAEREELRRAAQRVVQREADAPGAPWRQDRPPAGRTWSEARAEAVLSHVTVEDGRARVDVDAVTTPYTVGPTGADPRPGVPCLASRVFLFAPASDGWRLVEDLTREEFAG
ncbi:hypothetical protein ACIF8T_27070 [Streptomyces sp. NPDC085946]|uniref:hypothetical protein n=1 Tax=Streptomyces sp. NPDC085946 TaxID=3365744 RepID=UPI0037D14B17